MKLTTKQLQELAAVALEILNRPKKPYIPSKYSIDVFSREADELRREFYEADWKTPFDNVRD